MLNNRIPVPVVLGSWQREAGSDSNMDVLKARTEKGIGQMADGSKCRKEMQAQGQFRWTQHPWASCKCPAVSSAVEL